MNVDFLIIGAGLAGIGAAVHFKNKYPNKTFAIVEKRSSIGGTWDVFKYPGVRSDSDMFTLGYSFKLWTGNFFATGEEINNYIKETANEYNITEHIHFNTTANSLEWNNDIWTLYTNRETYNAKFVLCATGYINHEQSYSPRFKNLDVFTGSIVHTQHWQDIDYKDKNIAVIGSGATAYTLIPALVKQSKHVTMIQRSPSYIRLEDSEPTWLDRTQPREQSAQQQYQYYTVCKEHPAGMKRKILNEVKRRLDPAVDIKHFTPDYMPWDRRICTIVDNDFINAVNSGSVSVETDTIEEFTATGIQLVSGKLVSADIVVLATGFETRMMGNVVVKVNGIDTKIAERKNYKGVMLEDIPNFGFIFGYNGMSWTLKLDLALTYFDRVFEHMDKNNYTVFTPIDTEQIPGDTGFLDSKINFYLRNETQFPRQTSSLPWMNTNNYITDQAVLTHDAVDDGILQWK